MSLTSLIARVFWLGILVLLAGISHAPNRPEAGSLFDSARAWRDLERIVGFGPRPSGSLQSAQTRSYILQELKNAGIRTRVQSFTAETALGPVPMSNVIGEIPGRWSGVILIGGHYDTKYFPGFRFVGANDGGSSAALLIELARALARNPRQYTIWILFLDGEEERSPNSNHAASHGAQYFVEELRRSGKLERFRAAILADMIGDRDLDIPQDAGSTPWLRDAIWATARRLGFKSHFLDESVPFEDDHLPFLRAEIPATLLIDYNYGNRAAGQVFWHTAQDTLDKLSPRSLQVVGEVILQSLPAVEAILDRGLQERRR